MSEDLALWSQEKQGDLRSRLVGQWAADVWRFEGIGQHGLGGKRLAFTCSSGGVNVELKYALWTKYASGEWATVQSAVLSSVRRICAWLNDTAPSTQSLMSGDLPYWEASFRSYLVARSLYRRRAGTYLSAAQTYNSFTREDPCVCMLRQIYRILEDAYAGRVGFDGDVWDMRALGFRVIDTKSARDLNFRPIVQPWLQALAKQFIRYRSVQQSGGDCLVKLTAVTMFSRFLASPWLGDRGMRGPADIDRGVIMGFMSFLDEHYENLERRNRVLGDMGIFLKTCAYELNIAGVPREDLIFSSDYVEVSRHCMDGIPSEVLVQMREHFGNLPVQVLRMLVVNLACGMRVSELCTLSSVCLIQDAKGQWTLFCYQSKLNKEHAIPVVDPDVVATIQAQQEDLKRLFGGLGRYLFPMSGDVTRPFSQVTFNEAINKWIVAHQIRDSVGRVYRFRSHAVRHTVAMGWLRDGVDLTIIQKLLGHLSITMTERYAYRRQEEARAELDQMRYRDVTIDADLRPVMWDHRTEDPDVQLLHKALSSAVLPIGGCGRPRVLGPCTHVNRCFSCSSWRTSTRDLPALEMLARRNRMLLPSARQSNQLLCENIERDLPLLEQRIARHRELWEAEEARADERLAALQRRMEDTEAALSEAQESGLWLVARVCQRGAGYLRGELGVLARS